MGYAITRPARVNLEAMYYGGGNGDPQNYREAINWFRKAAELKYTKDQGSDASQRARYDLSLKLDAGDLLRPDIGPINYSIESKRVSSIKLRCPCPHA